MNHSTMEMESHVVDIMMIRNFFTSKEPSLFYLCFIIIIDINYQAFLFI